MKTILYNPSQLEIAMANALTALQPEIEARLDQVIIKQIDAVTSTDNPFLIFKLEDADGDLHEVVVQIIQRPDNFPTGKNNRF